MIGRSAKLPAAILGTLDAGAAFVPLDPDFPVMRLSYMCRDAGLALIIAEIQPSTPQELRDTGVQVVHSRTTVFGAVLPGAAPASMARTPPTFSTLPALPVSPRE